MEHQELTSKIIGCAMRVHRVLGPGFLEAIYQRALIHELGKAGVKTECNRRMAVLYDGIVLGEFSADLIAEDSVLIENKAVTYLTRAHEIQVVNYLAATGISLGLLLNFGGRELQFKRKFRHHTAKVRTAKGAL